MKDFQSDNPPKHHCAVIASTAYTTLCLIVSVPDLSVIRITGQGGSLSVNISQVELRVDKEPWLYAAFLFWVLKTQRLYSIHTTKEL
jgi:hypothetical protein